MKIFDTVGQFTWLWDDRFFIETKDHGNFIWSDPGYDGDNTIRKCSISYKQYLKENDIDFGRDKGPHIIAEYCGVNVVVMK